MNSRSRKFDDTVKKSGRKLGMKETFEVVGELRITSLCEGKLLFGEALDRALKAGNAHVDTVLNNLIVDIGLSVFSRLLGNNEGGAQVYSPAGNFGFTELTDITVARMELGNTVIPVAPTFSDTDSVDNFLYAPNIVVTYPGNFSVQYSGLVPQTDFDGEVFTEEALLLRNGRVFAKTIFTKAKTLAFALQFDHKISVARIFIPMLSLVTPSSGVAAGGTPVTLTGTNFMVGATVTFDGVAATSIVVVSKTSITCDTPAHVVGVVDVEVQNVDARSARLANGYTYV